jgi:methionyl-tRNA formyltransferase
MRIIFMGTPEFAVSSLDVLVQNNYNIVGVITSPDKPAGRGQQLRQSAIKIYALKHNLKILQPENLKDESFIKELEKVQADLQIVVAFRMLPEKVWNMPPLGTFNLHASLLPKYRGAAPINWAIINGESETGVTTFKLKHEIDTGNILYQEKIKIGQTTSAGELHDSLMTLGANLVLKTVRTIEESYKTRQELTFIPQNNENVCHAPKLTKETSKINWELPVEKIHNLIRGLSPYPAAYAELINGENKKNSVKIFRANFELIEHRHPNGLLITDHKTNLKVYCRNGILEILDLQLEGKKRLDIATFLRGYKLVESAHFI